MATDKGSSTKDKRKAERHATAALRTLVEVDGRNGRSFEAWYRVLDASSRGLFLEGGALLKPGTRVKITVKPTKGEPVVCEGKVVRQVDTDERPGMGIEFPADQQAILDRLLAAA